MNQNTKAIHDFTDPLNTNAQHRCHEQLKGFSVDQLRRLAKDVDARHVHTRDLDGRQLSYIEGWYGITQANAIFGYAGWDREMVHFERVTERSSNAAFTCAYIARVRIRVRAGAIQIVREGTGWGSASASTSSAAHERALKSAETDATKRALSTFGPRFGLRLYDKDNPRQTKPSFALFDPDGALLADNLSPEGFSTGLRQLIELCREVRQLDRLASSNAITIEHLRSKAPALRNAQGSHFSDLLLRLFQRKREQISLTNGSTPSFPNGNATDIDAGREDARSYSYVGQSAQRRRWPLSPTTPPQISDIAVTHVCPPLHKTGQQALSPAGNAAGEGPTSAFEANVDAATEPVAAEITPQKIATGDETSSISDIARGTTEDNSQPLTSQTALSTSGKTSSPFKANETRPATEDGQTRAIASGEQKTSRANPLAAASVEIEEPAFSRPGKIDKSKLWLPLEKRLRDKEHLKRVAQLPCLICSRQPSQAHHLRFAQRRGMSQKVSDEYTVPLCGLHHGDLHRSFSEPGWWAKQNIDPLPVSAELWAKHHPC